MTAFREAAETPSDENTARRQTWTRGFAATETAKAGLAASLLLAACIFGTVASPALADENTVNIPLGQDAQASIPNLINVSIGDGKPAALVFDTGSSGIRVMEQMVGPNVRKTDQKIRGTYANGTVVDGYVAYADISFPDASGPARTTRPIAIEVITHVSCGAPAANCSALPLGSVGYFGADYRGEDGLSNPFQALEGNLSSGFVVDATDSQNAFVAVGLTRGNAGSFDFMRVGAGARTTVDGFPTWQTDGIEACYTLDTMGPACQPVLFGTGSPAMTFALPGYEIGYFTDPIGDLMPGHTVTMQIGNAISLSLESTGDLRTDDIVVSSSGPVSNAGMPFFQRYAVAFDAREGRIGFQDAD
ncbi:hypothetical protein SAMN02745172_01928 [Pseudoxanthobacter soli DSM 19599]|uniref:Aspartyl protease n=1 Tax=Pseudoxanthobacter soli DSM 19599 TaxID=1123029 RepID=A0A1M7ZJY4_9HYPH|nr:hypothetical protein [Pseudoxanthobacter soli]SHO64976.1 hypothetical protein SAMN02745172_01928 [Pseudoxanthobacter soli DSM 19599]